ncbi:MAG: hypothetical protein M5U34_23945 [Chloroflexi bacterium]|nr:hypothetical protein [Chloroflexota bacterium]
MAHGGAVPGGGDDWARGELDDIVTAVTRLTPLLLGLDFCAVLLWDEERERYRGGDVYGASAHFTQQFADLRLSLGSGAP